MATFTQDVPGRQLDAQIIADLEHVSSPLRRRAGVATLTGKVDRQAEREDARRTVSAAPAASGVVNPIDARLPMSDADTRSRIAQTVARLAQIDAKHIDVNVDDHVVTLLGYVRCWSERQMVEQVAWAAPAVSAVHNRLAVPF